MPLFALPHRRSLRFTTASKGRRFNRLAALLLFLPLTVLAANVPIVESRPTGDETEAVTGLPIETSPPEATPGFQDAPPTTGLQDAPPATSLPATELPYRPPIEIDSSGASPMEEPYQAQLLQQEVMELRGLVEELRFQLSRMQASQDDRYLDLDSRLQQLLTAKPASSREPGATYPVEPAPDTLIAETPVDTPATEPPDASLDDALIDQPAAETPDAALVNTPDTTLATPDTPPDASLADPLDDMSTLDEESLYDTSLQLIRNHQYELAVKQLEALIARFPGGAYTPNAYYWLGEVYAAMPEPNYEQARRALAQVIVSFPDHHKIPDAAFKLGKVYYLLGDCERAERLLNRVIRENAGQSVAKLAATYLRETVVCDP